MPYAILVYSKQERVQFHRRGLWLTKDGNTISVAHMSYERLDRLVKMLAQWAMDQDDPIRYIQQMPIYPHVVARIRVLGMKTYQSSMFELASHVQYACG